MKYKAGGGTWGKESVRPDERQIKGRPKKMGTPSRIQLQDCYLLVIGTFLSLRITFSLYENKNNYFTELM